MFRLKLFISGKSSMEMMCIPGTSLYTQWQAGGPTTGGGTLDHLVRVLAARFLHCKANLRMLIELDIKWSLHKSQLLFRNPSSAIELYIKGDFSRNICMDKEDNGLISIR